MWTEAYFGPESNTCESCGKTYKNRQDHRKEGILDPVLMTLSKYYQLPEIIQPLDSDPNCNGQPSDHHNKNAIITQ